MADIYLAYGIALLENAISQATVLGKEQEQAEEAEEAGMSNADPLTIQLLTVYRSP
jgi:HAT1-interacting factor 1